MNRIMLTITALAALAVAGCAATASGTHAQVAAHTSPATAPSQSCAGQVQAWAQNQGSAQIDQIASDAGTISRDAFKTSAALSRGLDATSDLARWQAAATALQTDAQAASSNAPPACADPADYGTAMRDYTTSAEDYISAVSDISSGGYAAATTLIRSGTKAMNQGTGAITRATAAIHALGG